MSTPGAGNGGYGQRPQRPPGGDFAYSPYGSPPPIGSGPGSGSGSGSGSGAGTPRRVARPALLWVGLALVVLSTVPSLLGGVLVLTAPLNTSGLSPEMTARLADAGFTVDQAVQAVRSVGGVVVAIAVVYLLFAVLAVLGRNWARIVLAVFTFVFAALLLFALLGLGLGSDAGALSIIGGVLVLSVGGTVIYFLPQVREYFRAGR